MLRESEWNTINNILLELYTLNSIDTLAKKLMNVLRMLIPYTKGYFVMLDEDQQIIRDSTYFVGMEKNDVDKYLDDYYEEDYLKYLYDITVETMVYKDTSILDEDIRKETVFYKKFLQPRDIPYGCGILIIKNHRLIGIFNLFRSGRLGDFSDKDIYILDILKRHIENMIYNAMQMSRQQVMVERCYKNAKEKYHLTEREDEILHLLCEGMSNSDICDALVVSMSTVKKHIYNLYNKTDVKSRTQLVNLLYSQAE